MAPFRKSRFSLFATSILLVSSLVAPLARAQETTPATPAGAPATPPAPAEAPVTPAPATPPASQATPAQGEKPANQAAPAQGEKPAEPTADKPTEPQVLVAEVKVVTTKGKLGIPLEEKVYSAIRTRPGQTTTRSQLQQDINAVFATGYFADVKATPEDTPLGVRVTFDVSPIQL